MTVIKRWNGTDWETVAALAPAHGHAISDVASLVDLLATFTPTGEVSEALQQYITSLVVTGDTLQELSEVTGYIWALVDQNNRMALGVTPDGNVVGKIALADDAVTYDMLVDAIKERLIPDGGGVLEELNPVTGYAFALTDQDNRVALGVKLDGTVVGNVIVQTSSPTTTSGPVKFTKTGDALAIETVVDNGPLVINAGGKSSSNGGFNFLSTTHKGVLVHSNGDDITPVRIAATTIGGNHGYPRFSYTVVGHGKTIADVGSIWTDGVRQYTLMAVEGNDLVFTGPYTVSSGVSSVVATAPVATLTHVSGATVTTDVPITSPTSATQLYPSTGKVSVRYFLDGVEITTDGTYYGTELQVRESYEVFEFKALVDWAQAHIGQSYVVNRDLIPGAVRFGIVYSFRSKGRCTISHSLTDLTKVQTSTCGFIQQYPMSKAGCYVSRYMPDVKPKGGYDFKAGFDLTPYVSTLLFNASDLVNPAKPPDRMVDWLVDGSGNKVLGFTFGYIIDKTNARDADRLANVTNFWDMRGTKKSYPIAIEGVTLNPGDRRTFECYRNYLSPSDVGVATNINEVDDAGTIYLYLDFHVAVTAFRIPMPDHIGKAITVLNSTGLTLLNSVVDVDGVVVTTSGYGCAVLRLD